MQQRHEQELRRQIQRNLGLAAEREKLSHRVLELPDGRYSYVVGKSIIESVGRRDDGSPERWVLGLSPAPQVFGSDGVDDDAPLMLAQTQSLATPGARWLPLTLLIECGRFRRMQEWADQLATRTQRGCAYFFVSHRWLATSEPDPDGVQARFTGWQLVMHLCDAVEIAAARGLHTPRRQHPHLGVRLGIAGSELAESLLVNVLRFTLDETTLHAAAREADRMIATAPRYGLERAVAPDGLTQLSELLRTAPTLSRLVDRVYLWYDYSCLPQPPRRQDEQRLFAEGLKHLPIFQVLGRTAVLLDDAHDYLTRAWCATEAASADTLADGRIDLLVGSQRDTADEGEIENYFMQGMQDLPHILWRAILDTEVFGVQTAVTCMNRLGLRVTDANDLPLIYEQLRNQGAPRKIHIDDTALITGVLPLVTLDDNRTVLRPKRASFRVRPSTEPLTSSLNLTDALSPRSFAASVAADERGLVPSWSEFEPRHRTADVWPSCHFAIIAASEGEAALFASYVVQHRDRIEAALEVVMASLSWLAVDIAPVGEFFDAHLRVRPVLATTWAVFACSARFKHCSTTHLITEALRLARRRHWQIELDSFEDNVRAFAGMLDREDEDEGEDEEPAFAPTPSADIDDVLHVGGLHRGVMLTELFRRLPATAEQQRE